MGRQDTKKGIEIGRFQPTRQELELEGKGTAKITNLRKQWPRGRPDEDKFEFLLSEVDDIWGSIRGGGGAKPTRHPDMKLGQALDKRGRPMRLWSAFTGAWVEADDLQTVLEDAPYLPLAGGTLSGELVMNAAGSPYRMISGGGYEAWMRLQDGEGRMSQYWNASGGASPTFISAVEKAAGVIMTPTSNIAWEWIHSGPGTSHAADDPITWERVYTFFSAGGFQASLDLAKTADANIFQSTEVGHLRGGWNPYLDQINDIGVADDYRLLTSFKSPGTGAATMILADPHSHKYIGVYRDSTNQSITGANQIVEWNAEANKDNIFTHDNSTNPSRIAVDVTGLYDLNLNIMLEWASTTGTLRSTYLAQIKKNGSIYYRARAANNYIRNAEGNDASSINLSRMISLTKDDYIEIELDEVNTAGITLNILAGASELQLIYRGHSSV